MFRRKTAVLHIQSSFFPWERFIALCVPMGSNSFWSHFYIWFKNSRYGGWQLLLISFLGESLVSRTGAVGWTEYWIKVPKCAPRYMYCCWPLTARYKGGFEAVCWWIFFKIHKQLLCLFGRVWTQIFMLWSLKVERSSI